MTQLFPSAMFRRTHQPSADDATRVALIVASLITTLSLSLSLPHTHTHSLTLMSSRLKSLLSFADAAFPSSAGNNWVSFVSRQDLFFFLSHLRCRTSSFANEWFNCCWCKWMIRWIMTFSRTADKNCLIRLLMTKNLSSSDSQQTVEAWNSRKSSAVLRPALKKSRPVVHRQHWQCQLARVTLRL